MVLIVQIEPSSGGDALFINCAFRNSHLSLFTQGFIVRVQSWQKFNEVIQMMDSSLQGIVDRWADGKVCLFTICLSC